MMTVKTLLASAAVTTILAMPAMATPVTLNFTGQVGGSSVGGGGFGVDVTEAGSGDLIGSFISWCIELTQFINSNATIEGYVQSFDNGDTGQAGTPLAPEISDDEELLLSSLFSQNSLVANGGGTKAENDAFQLAVWDIAYNGGTASFGSFDFTSSGAGNLSGSSEAGAALSLLSSLDSTGGNYSFTYYLSNGNQDQLVGAQVPLPAGVVLLLGGLGAFGVMRRRQKAA